MKQKCCILCSLYSSHAKRHFDNVNITSENCIYIRYELLVMHCSVLIEFKVG